MINARLQVLGVLAITLAAPPLCAQQRTQIPLVRGLTIISALRFPDGDRENVVVVADSTSEGVTYSWRFREVLKDGGESKAEFTRFVRAADLAAAPRLNTVFTRGSSTSPGFTAFSISSATYDKLSADPSVPFSYTEVEGAGALGKALGQLGGMFVSRIVMRGTLERTSTGTDQLPLLLDNRRLTVPALHLKGRFKYQERQEAIELWVLADRTHPLLLRVVHGSDVLQVVRIELPNAANTIEPTLEKECSADLPGTYFAFGSAELEASAAPVLAAIAGVLQRHTDWSIRIEGHTDSVGTGAANADLSRRRAEAVRSALIAQHRVSPSRLTAAGFGAARPRESNATLEGRARNRRVELTRPCAARKTST
jgi:outer membrane protein OmpA-like peptidoglycan-associated protein